MKVPLSWLKQYVDVDLSAQEISHRLTMAGIEGGEVRILNDDEIIAVVKDPEDILQFRT